ncbi:MAG: Type 1 glutamine amidotransferase-like domain-containing protein [Actinomycetota bacterium]
MKTIALLGSGEFEPWARAVDGWSVDRSSVDSKRVLVVQAASAPEGEATFQRWARMGVEHYRALGLEPEVLPLRTRDDACDDAIVERVAGARLIFFSGGNPGYLSEICIGSPFWDAVVESLDGGTALGGCSAGASFLGARTPFVANDSLDHWTGGTRLLPRAFIVPHFDALESYQPGLRALFIDAAPEGTIPIGIDETTAMHGDGSTWSVTGSGAVWFPRDGDLTPHRDGETFALELGATR